MNKLKLPKVIFGTSGLGNLYTALPEEVKSSIVANSVKYSRGLTVFDSAGKYGAGLALEALGRSLSLTGAQPSEILISNKLGWLRTELRTPEPTFEPGVWKNLTNDAVQNISYEGIIECYEQGQQLLGSYSASMVSVHDPDEYLASAKDQSDRAARFRDIMGAYQALDQLKRSGKVAAVGIGAKNWQTIKQIAARVDLDWIMIANSLTVHSHPDELVKFLSDLHEEGITVINSAVFNAGFLTGGDYYNYQPVDPMHTTGAELIRWRNQFQSVCSEFEVDPAAVCVSFGLALPQISSVALNTTNPARVKANIDLADSLIPQELWKKLYEMKMISKTFAELLIN